MKSGVGERSRNAEVNLALPSPALPSLLQGASFDPFLLCFCKWFSFSLTLATGDPTKTRYLDESELLKEMKASEALPPLSPERCCHLVRARADEDAQCSWDGDPDLYLESEASAGLGAEGLDSSSCSPGEPRLLPPGAPPTPARSPAHSRFSALGARAWLLSAWCHLLNSCTYLTTGPFIQIGHGYLPQET